MAKKKEYYKVIVDKQIIESGEIYITCDLMWHHEGSLFFESSPTPLRHLSELILPQGTWYALFRYDAEGKPMSLKFDAPHQPDHAG